jgi:membrane-bound serine protease (ClpP class)
MPVTGASAMLDELGYALTAIDPGGSGHVRTHGEIWTASANERIEAGTPVRVTAVEGLRLRVAADSSGVVDLPPDGGSHA